MATARPRATSSGRLPSSHVSTKYTSPAATIATPSQTPVVNVAMRKRSAAASCSGGDLANDISCTRSAPRGLT